ncbi:MAG: cytochrome c biogenesis protein CcsA [Flavobacteriales bacterium]|nr:cytochrome c biogenesis protein CcsA [Flavobacteriales bacterium]
MDINYIGEHLWAGQLGQLCTVLAFVSAMVAAIAYAFAAKNDHAFSDWKLLSRSAFSLHIFSVFGIIGTLLYMLYNGMFEYHYIWQHSNSEMPMRYIMSSFWEGQEGSFLLWLFWHAVLGAILLLTAKKWEAPVMAVFALVQMFLVSMVLGINLNDIIRIGSSPFLLLRDHPDFANLPFLQNAAYLERLDGRGLNPLLQNYWMTIHPPTLFLGFASTLVPFAFAIAGLWKKKYTEWMKPALPWTFFGVMILGTGILMGGAWAYEALSFGGFWAWDPVENSSLVPWITLVGAAHVMVIQKNRGQSLIMTFVLTVSTFILILYSTFLTRSGILGDTSVHAFTDLGMSGQLLVYLLAFLFIAIILLIVRWKEIPKSKDEDSLYSREFWMFIGALVLVISSFQIMFTTSIPVWNKLLGTNLAPPLDPIAHYNSFQIPLAIMLSILIAVTQYFKYKKTDPQQFSRALLVPIGASVVLTAIIGYLMHYTNVMYILMLFTTLFLITANLNYWVSVLKGKMKVAGASVAHIGFGMILLGAFLSTSKTQIISMNTSGTDVESLGQKGDFSNRENILMMKGDTLRMADYFVTYVGKEKEAVNVFYQVDYLTKTESGYNLEFSLHPRVQTNPRMGNIAEPDTKHFLYKDIYSFVTYAEVETDEAKKEPEEYKNTSTKQLAPGDTLFAGQALIIFNGFNLQVDRTKYDLQEGDIAVAADLTALDISGKKTQLTPVYVIRDRMAIPIPAEMEDLGFRLVLNKVLPEEGKAEIALYEKPDAYREFIVMKAMIFPWINILWAGCLVMIIGTVMAIRRRLKS